ncbi:VOC family protein [Alteribacter lacisalsi]|uniref:VOC family protein n=1 Tax=Alteribacter lacisalsi TaxID=2045244 RepID=UPI001374FA48|nr:VOC family protein [Alteribacter lacisalsi]
MKIKTEGVSELVLEVKELEQSVSFWSGTLGFPVMERWGISGDHFDPDGEGEGAVWLYAGGNARLGLWLPRVFSDRGLEEKDRPVSEWDGLYDEGGVHVHFALLISSENFDSALEVLKKNGIPVRAVQEKVAGSMRKRLYFKDPDGHIAELYTRRFSHPDN